MKKIIDELWYDYMIEEIIERSNQEKEIIKEFKESEKAFRISLNKEQKSVFEKYDSSLSKVSRISEKNAFIKGVRFATKFLCEALY